MDNKITSLKRTARIAGFLYLSFILLGIYSYKIVQVQIMVKGDAVTSSKNILAHELLFRSGIFSSVAAYFIFLPLVLAFYKLLKEIDVQMAKFLVITVLVQIPISFLLDLLSFTSLMILKGEVMKDTSVTQKVDFAWLFLQIHNYGQDFLELYWGIWLIPLGWLVYKSGYIWSVIGILLMVGGLAYIADSVTYMVFPAADNFVSKLTNIASLAELSIMLWLVIVGVRIRSTAPTMQ